MCFPLLILSYLSFFTGYLLKDMFIGLGTNFWEDAIFIRPEHYTFSDAEFLPWYIKTLPLIFTILGGSSSYFLYSRYIDFLFRVKQSKTFITIYTFFNKKWFFDKLYNELIIQNLLSLSNNFFYKNIDRGWLEFLGPSGIYFLIKKFSVYIKSFYTGFIIDYFLYSILIIVFTISFFCDNYLYFGVGLIVFLLIGNNKFKN